MLDRRKRVRALPNHDYAAHRLRAGLVERAASLRRSQTHGRDMAHQHRNVVYVLHHGLRQVFGVAHQPAPTDNVLDAVHLDRSRPNVHVRSTHRFRHVVERNAVHAQGIRIDVDLVLLDVTADGSDLADALGRRERVPHIPVLHAA